MEICETQEEESEEELRWATSDEDEFKQAAPPRPFEVSRHSPRSHCEQQGESESEECRMATSDEDAPHERVVGRDKAEAPRRHLFRKRGKVYMLTNTVTGKSYVGQLEDAKAFWGKEWERYERKYWSVTSNGSIASYFLPPQASSAQSKGKSEQVYKANGSSATGVPKSRPSCASTEGVSNDSLLAESDGEPWGLG